MVGAVTGVAMVLLAGAREADAYVRYQSDTGASFAWMPSCLPLPIVVYPGTFSQMTIEEVTRAVTGAAAAWSAGANPCTFIEFEVTVASGPAPRASNDAAQRDHSSQHQLVPPRRDRGLRPDHRLRSGGAGADVGERENVHWRDRRRRYRDQRLPLSVGRRVAHPELTDRHDLQNALTHEIGHLLGLDHSCFFGSAPAPNDHTGQPIPDCANATASVLATTMFPSANPGDVEKRTLEPDDRAGVCGIYPAAATPCPPGAACTCPPPGTDAGQDAGGGSPDARPADAPPADAPPRTQAR